MNKTNSADFIKCLNILNISTKGYTENTFKYLFDDENTCKLLTFFCNYIANDNVISKQEYETFKNLKQNNLILTDDQLEAAITEIDNNYDGIFEIADEDLEILQEELKIEKEYLKELEGLITLNRENNQETEYGLRMLEVYNSELNEKLERSYESLNEICCELNQVEEDITKMGFDIINSYKSQSISYVDHLLYTFKRNSDIILNLLFNFMQSGFKKSEMPSYLSRLLDAHLQEFKIRLSESLEANILAKAEYECQKMIYDEITSGKSLVLPSSDQIAFEIFRYNQLVEQTKQEIASMNYLISNVSQVADNQISEFLIKYNETKLEKRKKTNENIENLLYYITNIRNQCRFLDAFLFYNCEIVNQLQNLLIEIFKSIHYNQASVDSRLKCMSSVTENFNNIKSNPVLSNSEFLQKFIQLGCSHESNDLVCLYKDLDQIHNNYCQLLNLVFHENWNKFQEDKRKIEKKITSTKRIIKNSHQIDILKLMYKTEEMIKKENDNADNIINEFKKIQKRLKSDKWFKYHHFLWVWFLIQPKKILKVINEIHQAVD